MLPALFDDELVGQGVAYVMQIPLKLGYAVTIHKSQGSQFNHALVALPITPSRIVTRELLYTAVTRAADKVTIIGSEASLQTGVGQSVSRSSGLPAALSRLP